MAALAQACSAASGSCHLPLGRAGAATASRVLMPEAYRGSAWGTVGTGGWGGRTTALVMGKVAEVQLRLYQPLLTLLPLIVLSATGHSYPGMSPYFRWPTSSPMDQMEQLCGSYI